MKLSLIDLFRLSPFTGTENTLVDTLASMELIRVRVGSVHPPSLAGRKAGRPEAAYEEMKRWGGFGRPSPSPRCTPL